MANRRNRNQLHCFWAHEQAPARVSVRNARETRRSRRPRRPGAGGETRSAGPLSVRFRTSLSSGAACRPAAMTACSAITTF